MGVFELLDKDLLESATSARNAPRPPPLNQEEWLSFLNTEGVLLCSSTQCLSEASVEFAGMEYRCNDLGRRGW